MKSLDRKPPKYAKLLHKVLELTQTLTASQWREILGEEKEGKWSLSRSGAEENS